MSEKEPRKENNANTSEEKPRYSRKTLIILGALIFIGGILFTGVFSLTLGYTNTTEFCTSCHTMETNLAELKKSLHYNNAYGITIGCADCHVPRSLGPKLWAKFMAVKDLYHHFITGKIDTPEKYEEHRWEMANAVWDKMKASNSRECRECHSFDHMDYDEQDRSCAKKHEWGVKKDKTCIDCHQGIAHELPKEFY
jgi:cytochrome c-type protein NapC